MIIDTEKLKDEVAEILNNMTQKVLDSTEIEPHTQKILERISQERKVKYIKEITEAENIIKRIQQAISSPIIPAKTE